MNLFAFRSGADGSLIDWLVFFGVLGVLLLANYLKRR